LVYPEVFNGWVPCRLSGFKNHYKIKLRATGYRLVHEVIDEEFYIVVIVVVKSLILGKNLNEYQPRLCLLFNAFV